MCQLNAGRAEQISAKVRMAYRAVADDVDEGEHRWLYRHRDQLARADPRRESGRRSERGTNATSNHAIFSKPFNERWIPDQHRADILLAFLQLGCALISLHFLG
jgi:hypothetical protein